MRYTVKQIKQNKISHDWHAFEMCSKCVLPNVQLQEPGAATERCPDAVHTEHTQFYHSRCLCVVLSRDYPTYFHICLVPPHKVSTMIICIYKQGSWSTDQVISPSLLEKGSIATYPVQQTCL